MAEIVYVSNFEHNSAGRQVKFGSRLDEPQLSFGSLTLFLLIAFQLLTNKVYLLFLSKYHSRL